MPYPSRYYHGPRILSSSLKKYRMRDDEHVAAAQRTFHSLLKKEKKDGCTVSIGRIGLAPDTCRE
jgi:hypothetical protein